MYILDTDHLTILEQPGGPARQRLVAQLAKHPPEDVATTVITYEEQTRGWFAFLARAKSVAQEIAAYDRLLQHLDVFGTIPVLPMIKSPHPTFKTFARGEFGWERWT